MSGRISLIKQRSPRDDAGDGPGVELAKLAGPRALFLRNSVRSKAHGVFDNRLKSHSLEVRWQEHLSRCWWRRDARHRYDKAASNEVRVQMPQKVRRALSASAAIKPFFSSIASQPLMRIRANIARRKLPFDKHKHAHSAQTIWKGPREGDLQGCYGSGRENRLEQRLQLQSVLEPECGG